MRTRQKIFYFMRFSFPGGGKVIYLENLIKENIQFVMCLEKGKTRSKDGTNAH